jgi:outer membrane protein OmpA-like peptidoglycan-associated protein
MEGSMKRSALILMLAAGLGACQTGPRISALARAEPHCADIGFPIYFATGSIRLSAPALQAIRTAAERSRGCRAALINVTGLADADGGAQRNEVLARQRAETVAAALTAQGFPAPAFDVESAGSVGALTAAGSVVPVRRQAVVLILFER